MSTSVDRDSSNTVISVQGMSPTNHGEGPSTSTTTPTGDFDWLYASWFCDEVDLAGYESMSDVEMEVGPNDESSNSQRSTVSLPDILKELSSVINLDSISKFNISRSHVWEGTVRALTRKSFSPHNKVSVKFCDDVGTSEGAIDLGGPKREFFTLVLDWLMHSQLFCGSDSSKYFSCNATSQGNNDYFHAGEIVAMSLVHGGPGFGCLSPSLYQCIVEGPNNVLVNVSDVYDVELRSSLEKLLNAKSTDEANAMIDKPPLSTLLDLAGTFKFVSSLDEIPTLVQQTVKWFLLGRSHFSQEQFVQGLSVLGIYDSILKNPESFRPAVFCYSPQQLNAEIISHLFETNFSEVGSNRHCSESLVISHWNDYLLDVEERAETEVTFNDILFFASGCKIIPPFRIKLSLEFLHHAEKNGEMSKFPKANTCACILYLPVTHSSYDKFKEALSFAFLNTRGFGEP